MADTTKIHQIPAIPLASDGRPGFTVPQALEELRKRVNDQWAQLVYELNVLFSAPSGGGGTGTDAPPTNAPTPTSITVSLNTDGSADFTLSWNYTDGVFPADIFILFWREGAAPLPNLTTADAAIAIPASARTFTFQGWDPNSNYRFGMAAARKGTADTVYNAGSLIQPTSAPDWADVGATGNYTANIGGSAAATVVANAANGQTAFTGTTNYRSAGAPTNNPVPASLTTGIDSDGSARYTLAWNYTQSTLKADGFFFFVKEGDTASFALTDPHFELGAQNTGSFSTAITLKGYPSDRALSFGAAAFRRTELGLEIGTIITSASAPDWQGITTGTPNYAGTIFGVEQHNFLVTASGYNDAGGTAVLKRDGADLIWAARDNEFLGGPRGPYGLAYNLTIYDLINKSVVYQHCYDTLDFGAAVTSADILSVASSGGGVVGPHPSGKFGYGLVTVATTGQVARYVSQAASTLYSSLKWVEIWFKLSANPSARGVIVGVSEDAGGLAGYVSPILTVGTAGRITAWAWNGSAHVSLTPSTIITDGNWHHLAAAIISGNLYLFIDGVANSVADGTLTSFTMSPPGGGVFLGVGYNSFGQVFGTAFYDELIVSTQTVRSTGANFTVPTTELSDYAGGLAGTLALWHFQEVGGNAINARKAPKALGQVLNDWTVTQLNTPGFGRFLFILQGCHEPQANRLTDNLVDYLEAIGARRALFSANTFQSGSSYILVGEPGRGAGNGLEAYSGLTSAASEAHCEVTFQTQADRIVGGSGFGWDPLDAPGAPTNNPVPSSASVTNSATGSDIIVIGWTYTQPALTGANKLADGFIVFVKSGNDATPGTNPTASYQVDINSRQFTMQSPLNQNWSFAVASYRRTANGLEVGPPITSSSAPDWQGLGGVSQVINAGLGDASVSTTKYQDNSISNGKYQDASISTAKIQDASITNAKINSLSADKITTGLLTVNPSSGGATAIFVDNAGAIRLKSMVSSPSQIKFEDGSGIVRATLAGDLAGQFIIGASGQTVRVNANFMDVFATLYMPNPAFDVTGSVGSSAANNRVRVYNAAGTPLGYLRIYPD